MTYIRSLLPIVVVTTGILATSAWASVDDRHDSNRSAQTTAVQVAQAGSGSPRAGMRAGSDMSGYADQMKAMQEMHDRMAAARTPEERNALMNEQMNLMQNGMSMMGTMGGTGGMAAGAAMGKADDVAARQRMMEQRMDMMQAMMQMMMDRMQSVPATK